MKTKLGLKVSTIILTCTFLLMILGVFASNIVFKRVYDQLDKSDLYWNYNNVLAQPYKHLKIEGGNVTNIIFEPSKRASVRILNYWRDYRPGVTMKVFVKNDTLHLIFPNKYDNEGEKYWLQSNVTIRLFAPQLLSVDGSNTNFELQKMKQGSISINLRGKSRLEVESYRTEFDSIRVAQTDSSQVVFEMAADLKSSKKMHFGQIIASLNGNTLLDVGRGYADKLKLNLADSSAMILSGRSLKAIK